ncbi:carbamoyltransferase C-terminal domain-containing protein [Pseudomonas sp. LP_7_YM]|uniref:carbamoyltransferase family protein n=1 Tax=Pseudomonas sp. LP_7_YM TaxID=2485137 RepID=UPI00105E8A5B|nr:carbamoyltransferase C-terminal domain-containing protein [Pseudomonas sp. LP_7_YM]TDV61817.1 carbamoyltransferase [Pseudomonas sp. LP_7_YM]
MIVLGITNNDLSGACLVRDNQILSAVSEERFTRIKDHKVWPSQSIDFVLGQAGITINDVDYVAYGWSAGFNAEKHLPLYFDRIVEEVKTNPEGLSLFRKRMTDEIKNDKEKRAEFDAYISNQRMSGKAYYIDHHECHALGAYVCSPFDEALTLTCDGRGDFQALTLTHYSPGETTVLQRETSIDSLGYFYGRITHLIGYKPNRHEGKITGLAAFGEPNKLLGIMQKMIRFEDGRIKATCGDMFIPSYQDYSEPLQAFFSNEKKEDIAAAVQQHTEDLLVAIITHHLNQRGSSNLCLAGGVFGNVKLNQRLREIPGVKDVYVLPCMGDGGLALAAAVGTAYLINGTRFKNPAMTLGPEARSISQNINLLNRDYPQLNYHKPADMIETLVEALMQNQVLGMFKGKMEFGPRSLCNRSIIYHAKDADVNDWLNKRMHRTEFMPFGPVTAIDQAAECYIGWTAEQVAADTMTMTYDCHPDFIKASPAVVHIDGTARPQVVRPQADDFMHRLLNAWYDRTGQSALINTSFNRHEEPIVCSSQDALAALNEGIVDLVIMSESLIVWHRGKNSFAQQYFE